jgi:hypothetical protein
MITSKIEAQATREISSTQQAKLGTLVETIDGRRYRYAANAAVELAIGLMNEQSAIIANHANKTVTAAVTVGSKQVSATLGATAATVNYYKDGYLLVNDNTGQGAAYSVAGHAAVASSGVITVDLNEPITTALGATSEVTLLANPWKGVIVVPSAATSGGNPAGVNNILVTASYFCWLQTGGVCAMLSGTTPQTLGDAVSQEASGVAGSASPAVATCPIYGTAMQLGVATEYQLVYLRID